MSMAVKDSHKCLYVEMCGPEYKENVLRVVSSGGG